MARHGQTVKYANQKRGLVNLNQKNSYNTIGDDIKYNNEFLTQDRVEAIFSFYGLNSRYDSWHDASESVSDEYTDQSKYEWDSEYAVQLNLQLETIEEVEEQLKYMIRKYQDATRRMSSFALLWYDLMEDIETIPNLKEEFDKFQMIRKMRGGTL